MVTHTLHTHGTYMVTHHIRVCVFIHIHFIQYASLDWDLNWF